jgi:hypothetical protein
VARADGEEHAIVDGVLSGSAVRSCGWRRLRSLNLHLAAVTSCCMRCSVEMRLWCMSSALMSPRRMSDQQFCMRRRGRRASAYRVMLTAGRVSEPSA